MSNRIIESMRHFKYFKKLHNTRKESLSHFFSNYFLSKNSEKIENQKPNVNFIFKFSDYKSLNLETAEDIFIKELKKGENEEVKEIKEVKEVKEVKFKDDPNNFYGDVDNNNNKRNINVMMNILNRNKKCRRYFKYNDITEEQKTILLLHSTHRKYKKDTIIFKAGGKQTAFYFLIRGKIALKSMNQELIRRHVIKNGLKMDYIYNKIKAEEQFKLQDKSDDDISLDNFISKTNLEIFNPKSKSSKTKLTIRSTSSKKVNQVNITRATNRVTTFKLDALSNSKNIIQEKILIENFHKIQSDLSCTIKTFSQGDFFCDWEIILDKPHTETAFAIEDTDLLILPKKYFDRYFANHIIKTDNERKIFLTKRIEFLHINNVINLKPEFYDKGEVIYTQFDHANEFFVLYKGKGALMELNENYIYRKKSDIIFNVQDMRIICYLGEGCVVGLESFNDGLKKYDNNFVIDEDNTVIYRIKMHTINMDNYLKKKNKIKLKKQLNEMYLEQNGLLPNNTRYKRLTKEEKIYKKKEEEINNIFHNAKAFFRKKLNNEKRIATIYGDLNQINEMNKHLTNKRLLSRKDSKLNSKKLPTIDTENISSNFKRRSKFHFLTTINKSKLPLFESKDKDKDKNKDKEKDIFKMFPFKNNSKNTLESIKKGKKENTENNSNQNSNKKRVPGRFSMFSFNFKSTLFKDVMKKVGNKNNNNLIETKKEDNFFDFYGDTNNDFLQTSSELKSKKRKKITSDHVDKYISKTIKSNKGNFNYNSGNFKIPLFSSKKNKKSKLYL